MTTSLTRVYTRQAANYLAQLGRYWQKIIPGTLCAEGYARIPFSRGMCELRADDFHLDIVLTAKSVAAAALLEDFVAEHLDSLSGREELEYHWMQTADDPSKADAKRRNRRPTLFDEIRSHA